MSPDDYAALLTLIGALIMAVVAGVVALAVQHSKTAMERQKLDVTLAELRPDNGNSMKDNVTQIVARQASEHIESVAYRLAQDATIARMWEEGHEFARNVTTELERTNAKVEIVKTKVKAVDSKVDELTEGDSDE